MEEKEKDKIVKLISEEKDIDFSGIQAGLYSIAEIKSMLIYALTGRGSKVYCL